MKDLLTRGRVERLVRFRPTLPLCLSRPAAFDSLTQYPRRRMAIQAKLNISARYLREAHTIQVGAALKRYFSAQDL